MECGYIDQDMLDRATTTHGGDVLMHQVDDSAVNRDEAADNDLDDDDDLDDIEAELLLSQMASRAFQSVKSSPQEPQKSFEKFASDVAASDVKQLCLTVLNKVGLLIYFIERERNCLICL